MRFYSNSTTARLEGYARARGFHLGIVISPDNAAGRYFVVSEDHEPYTRWLSLGWTREGAQEAIEDMAYRRAHPEPLNLAPLMDQTP